jgi:hypothetical protein
LEHGACVREDTVSPVVLAHLTQRIHMLGQTFPAALMVHVAPHLLAIMEIST